MTAGTIKHWAAEDRPREKLAEKGMDALSSSELLAILINTGTKEKSAVRLARELLQAVGGDLGVLSRLSVTEIRRLGIKGLGPAKAMVVAVALELGNRRSASAVKRDTVVSSRDMAALLRDRLQYKNHEVFVAVYLNRANRVKHIETISQGGLTATVADPRVILKKALEQDAVSLILSHNHPSGNIRPSMQDQLLTEKIKQAAALFDIKLLDHIIVSEEGYFSFADEGMI